MVIGGFQKNSFIDYPGKISCVVFLSGCNFHCPYCQNPDLVKGVVSSSHTREEVFSFIEKHRGFLEGVVISGGEPAIHPDLISLCRDIKAIGYPIKLDTNGSCPSVLNTLIETHLIDYIAMDIKTDPYAYAPFIQEKSDPQDLLASIKLIQDAGLPYEFRTTCVTPFISPQIMERICRWIDGAMLYALQRFNPKTILCPEFFKDTQAGMDDTEMGILKSIADQKVKKCIIR